MNRRQFPRFLDLRRHHAAQARDAGQGVPRGMQESPQAADRVGEVLQEEAGSAVKKPPWGWSAVSNEIRPWWPINPMQDHASRGPRPGEKASIAC